MKKCVLFCILFVFQFCVYAQEGRGVGDYSLKSDTSSAEYAKSDDIINQLLLLQNDSLVTLPTLNLFTGVPRFNPCSFYGGFNDWNLHTGLNASLGMSVKVGLGKNSYQGAGFSQNLAVMYATSLTDRISLAVGGYFSNLNWNSVGYSDAGLSAVLGYHIDKYWDAYIYAQKSLANPKMTKFLRYMDPSYGDRFGAMISYKVSPSATISVSVETVRK
jgi:hypothetical protein